MNNNKIKKIIGFDNIKSINSYFSEEHELLSSNEENYFENLRKCCRYHYTNITALKDILESKCIYLTHFSSLNDTSEGKLILKRVLPRHPNLANDIFNLLTDNLFICSFSFFGNQLSQWRGYGDVNIGFDFANMSSENGLSFIEDRKSKEHVTSGLGKCSCEYFDENHNQIEELERKISELLSNIHGSDYSLYQYELLTIGMLCFSFKHIGFSEERESRIYSFLWSKEPFFTNSTKKPIRYVKYHFEPEYVKRIVIGPSPNQDSNCKQIKNFLKEKPEYKIDVYKSTIPYIHKKK